jgi:hypothetical protein
LQVPQDKLKSIKKELGKLVKFTTMSPRKMSAILGQVRSFLVAMPLLRSFTDMMLAFIRKQQVWGWDMEHPIPKELHKEVRELEGLMETWKGRLLEGNIPVRTLHSDSSDHTWAGVDTTSGTIVKEFWRKDNILHINVKELKAAVNTIKSLAKPKENIILNVDNSVAFYYLKKGGGSPT